MSHVESVSPQALDERQLRMYRGAFWLVILSETFVFVALFAIRFLLAGAGHPAELNGLLGALVSAVFLGSLAPAVLAQRAIASGDAERMSRALAVAFGLGLLALGLIVLDWATLPIPATSRFGSAYIATTGIHALHIVIGLLFLAALWSSGRRGRFTPGNHWLVEAGVRFWGFVAAAWIALYAVFFWL